MQKINEVIKGLIKQEHEYEDNQKTEFTVKEVVPTGFTDIDKSMQGGLKRGELVVIGSRPGMGKTSFAMNVAYYVAVTKHTPVAVFSMETSIEHLVLRILSSEAGIDHNLVRDALSQSMLKNDQWSSLINVSRKLSRAPFYIDDKTDISPQHIHERLCRLNEKHTIGLVVIDYLQLMSADSSASTRDLEISEIVTSLKAIAEGFHVPVVLLSQMNRNQEERPDKTPRLSDFRMYAAIEQNANIICFIYRDEVYNPETPDKCIADIITAKPRKPRSEPVDTIHMKWCPNILKFEDLPPHENQRC